MQRGTLFTITIVLGAVLLLDRNVAAADDPHTLADCSAQYSQCFEAAGFFGYFFCPQLYADCVSQVRSRLPPEINQTLDRLNACSRADAACRTAAEGDENKLATCSRKDIICDLDAFGVQPPPDAPKNKLCVQTAVSCVDASETTSELEACGLSLRRCLEQPTPPL